MAEQTVDKQKELGLKSDPYEDAARLFCSWNAKHSADTQLSQACANIMARMDAGKPVGSDFLEVLAPPALEQQHIGNGVYQGVEVKAEDMLKALPGLPNPVPQVDGKDPVGVPLPGSWNAKHSADTQLSQACANIMARMDAGKPVGSDFLEVLAPPALEQQHIGNGVYQGVEVKAEDMLKALPGLPNPVPQVDGKDPVGVPLPGKPATPVLETVSVQPSSTSTAQPVK